MEAQAPAPSGIARPAVRDIKAAADKSGVDIEIWADAAVVPESSRLENPNRLVFDFPGFLLHSPRQRIVVNQGPVVAVRASLFRSGPPTTRVVVDLKEPVDPQIKPDGTKVLIRIPFATREKQWHPQIQGVDRAVPQRPAASDPASRAFGRAMRCCGSPPKTAQRI